MDDKNGSIPRFEGETVTLGGKEFVMPSLSTKRTRKLWDKIKVLSEGITVDNLPKKQHDAVEVIHAALSRNYPQMTFDDVDDLVDMNNMKKLLLIVSGQSGLTATGSQPAGADNQAASTGLTSIGPSSPEPAGVTKTLTN